MKIIDNTNANGKKGDEKEEFTHGLLIHIQLKYDKFPLILHILCRQNTSIMSTYGVKKFFYGIQTKCKI